MLTSELADEAFNLLPGHLGDEVEVLVDVEGAESGAFGDRGDQQIGNSRCAVVPTLGQQTWTATARSSTAGIIVSMSSFVTGGWPMRPRQSVAERAENPSSSRVGGYVAVTGSVAPTTR